MFEIQKHVLKSKFFTYICIFGNVSRASVNGRMGILCARKCPKLDGSAYVQNKMAGVCTLKNNWPAYGLTTTLHYFMICVSI